MELDDAVEVPSPKPAASHHPLPSSSQPESKNEMVETKETDAALASMPAVPAMPANGPNGQLQRPPSPAGAMADGAGSANREPTGAAASLAPPSPGPLLVQHEPIPVRITRSASKLPNRDKEPQKRQLQQGKRRRADSAAAAPPAGLPLSADHAFAAPAADSAVAPGQTDAAALLSNAKDRSVQELLTRSLEEMEAEMAAAGTPLSDTGEPK